MLLAVAASSMFVMSGFIIPANSRVAQGPQPLRSTPLPLGSRPIAFGATPPAVSYDEQLGTTFTQSFASLSYNVTAVAQSDSYGYGPAYLLNGLTTSGYWYQVGLSYDWPYTAGGYVPGFALNYDVFDSGGGVVSPSGGGGGLLNYSGTVNAGDTVLLQLSFSGGNVLMYSKDLTTGSTASTSYSSEGSTSFMGLNSVSNYIGFFTGLMTEKYSVDAYYGNEQTVTYSDKSVSKTSGILWADEFDIYQLFSWSGAFFEESGILQYGSNPTQLQAFSSHGATEAADAWEYISGNLLTQISASYSVVGGGVGYTPPVLSYVSDGVHLSVPLTTSPTQYSIDRGSQWSVIDSLTGSGTTERWHAHQGTNGTAAIGQTISITYYHQYQMSFVYDVKGGGSGYSSPTIHFSQYGSTQTGPAGMVLWVDAGTLFSFDNPLLGSSTSERWEAPASTGNVTATGTATASYYHQYSFDASYSIVGGGSPSVPTLNGTSFGVTSSMPLSKTLANMFLDSGTAYSVSTMLHPSTSSERWSSTTAVSGVLSGPASASPSYYHQYFISVAFSLTGGGNPGAPLFSYSSYGSAGSTLLGAVAQSFWADAGQYNTTNPLSPSTPSERWYAADAKGVLTGPGLITLSYSHQFFLTLVGIPQQSQWEDSGTIASVSVNGVFARVASMGSRITGYSVDGGVETTVTPTTGPVVVAQMMNAPHTISFTSVTQYQITLDAGATASLSSITTPTISSDNYWYDSGTPVAVVLNGVWGRSGGEGERLSSYSVDGVTNMVSSTGQVQALQLSITSPHSVTGVTVTQYQLTVASGSVSSGTGPTIMGDMGWYDSGTAVTTYFDDSWNLSNGQRLNAVSYTLGGSSPATLVRSGSGYFSVQTTMNSPVTIAVDSVTQYQFSLTGGSGVNLSQSSPTSDSFFDAGTSLTATTDNVWGLVNGNTRQNLYGYNLDGQPTNVTRLDNGTFTTPPISFGAPHTLAFESVTQYLISFQFKDSTGTGSITPTSFEIQVNDPRVVSVPSSQIWLDKGSTYRVSSLLWEGSDVKPANETYSTVTAPSSELIHARIYDAKLEVTDYLGTPISGAQTTFTLANGTVIKATTGGDGIALVRMIPLGTFQASVSYLGVVTSFSGDVSSNSIVAGKVFASYPTIILLIVAVVAVVLVGLFYRRRRKSVKPTQTSDKWEEAWRESNQ